jgi:hypothetical protein
LEQRRICATGKTSEQRRNCSLDGSPLTRPVSNRGASRRLLFPRAGHNFPKGVKYNKARSYPGNCLMNYCVVKLTRIIYSGTLLCHRERYVQ